MIYSENSLQTESSNLAIKINKNKLSFLPLFYGIGLLFLGLLFTEPYVFINNIYSMNSLLVISIAFIIYGLGYLVTSILYQKNGAPIIPFINLGLSIAFNIVVIVTSIIFGVYSHYYFLFILTILFSAYPIVESILKIKKKQNKIAKPISLPAQKSYFNAALVFGIVGLILTGLIAALLSIITYDMFFDNYGFIIIFLPFLIIYVLFFLILPFFVCGICLEQGQKKQPSKKGKTIAIFLLSVFSLELLCPLVTMPIDKKRYDDHKIYTKEKWQSSSMREKKIMIDDMEEKLTLMNASQDYVISNLGAPDKKETDEKDTSIENWSWLIDKDSWLDTVYTYFTVSFQNEKVIKYEVTYYYEN